MRVTGRRATIVAAVVALVVSTAPVAQAGLPRLELPFKLKRGASRGPGAPARPAGSENLVGIFELTKGACSSGGVTSGSYFRMIDPNGSPVQNSDSPCGDKSYTPISPGSDRGLSTAAFQPHPSPPFSGTGNSGGGRASRIAQPQKFFGVEFAIATEQRERQANVNVTVPAVTHDGAGKLTGDLRALNVAWNGQYFNQGCPKPDGSRSPADCGPRGTYSASSKAYTLEWSSTIATGPFDGFTGRWKFEGTFRSNAQASSPPPGGGSTKQTVASASTGSSRRTTSARVAGVTSSNQGELARTGPGSPVPAGAAIVALGLIGLGVIRRRPLRRFAGSGPPR